MLRTIVEAAVDKTITIAILLIFALRDLKRNKAFNCFAALLQVAEIFFQNLVDCRFWYSNFHCAFTRFV